VSLVVSSILIAAGVLLGSGPAAAADSGGVGVGRAVSHIDAPTATIVKIADDTYTLTLPRGTTGQWMGTRKGSDGVARVRVGDLTGEQLASAWKKFRYTSSPVEAILLWNTDEKVPATTVVLVTRSKVTPDGVTFALTSNDELPSELSNVSLSLSSARAKHQTRTTYPNTQTANIADDLWVSAVNKDWDEVTARIYNATNNNTCFTKTLNSKTTYASVGSNTCDNIAYTNAVSQPNYGVVATIPTASTGIGVRGSVGFQLLVTPPGEDQYEYSYTFQWTA
jgi:hypothetical protein